MGEQATIDGVVGGGEDYVPQMPDPVTPHQPIANVDPDVRGIIDGKQRDSSGGAKMNQASVQKTLETTEMDLKELTYSGKGLFGRLYLKASYAVHVTEPMKELEKIRNEVEGRIAVDQEKVTALDDKIDGIDMLLDGMNKDGDVIDKYAARRLMNSAEALHLEYSTALEAEERQKGDEEVKMNAAKDRFYELTGDTDDIKEEKEKLAEVYQAYEQNIVARAAKIKGLKDKLATSSRHFNTYFDNVDRAEGFKAQVETTKESLLLDKATLEGVSYDLRFLLNMGDITGTGAVPIAKLIFENQAAMEHYNGLVQGLEKINGKQEQIVSGLPDVIESKRRQRNRKKEKDTSKLQRTKESEIELAKQRIKQRSGLAA